MRTREDVLEKFYYLRAKTLSARKVMLLSRRPCNCAYNVRIPIKEVGKIGMCQNPELLKKRDRPLVCNDDKFAERCESFCCLNNEESVEAEFSSILASPSRCGEEYPKLAMLIWFLQDDDADLTRLGRLWRHVVKIICESFKVVSFRWMI
jgi:hypothetical protein